MPTIVRVKAEPTKGDEPYSLRLEDLAHNLIWRGPLPAGARILRECGYQYVEGTRSIWSRP